MPPMRIVPPIDVPRERRRRPRPRRPGLAIEELAFHRRKEALDHGVVVAVPATTHAYRDAPGRQGRAVVVAGIDGGFNRSSQHLILKEVCDDPDGCPSVEPLYSDAA